MNREKDRIVEYSILDPTGNITALVRTAVDAADRPSIAGRIMACCPEVEQVGFVKIKGPGTGEDQPLPELVMAGGEFCGNASMSAAAICLMEDQGRSSRTGSDADDRAGQDRAKQPSSVFLKVSGVCDPVEVRMREEGPGTYQGSILMPEALEIGCREFHYGSIREVLPVVRMQGISHVIIDENKKFFGLANRTKKAEGAVRAWCEELLAQGLGLMFLKKNAWEHRLIPLVYIPGSDTVYWENSCASGTSAVGMYFAGKDHQRADLTVKEPGGILRVESDPQTERTWLHGRVRLVKNLKMNYVE